MVAHGSGSHPGRLDQLVASLGPDERNRVHMLSDGENAEMMALSLSRFPHASWGAIEWEGLPILARNESIEGHDAELLLAEWILRYTRSESDVVIFWGNLVMPSVRMPARIAAGHSDEVLGASHDLWLFARQESVLIEYYHEGIMTAARIP